MRVVGIAKLEVDNTGRLLVYPEAPDLDYFRHIYRAGAEVCWDDRGYFYSPVPSEWSYRSWLEQILFAVRDELGVQMVAMEGTNYVAIPNSDESMMRLVLARSA